MLVKNLWDGFVPQHRLKQNDIVFLNARSEPFKINGVFYDDKCGRFLRMDRSVAACFDDVFKQHNTRTAGGRVRFMTDSPYVALFVKQTNFVQLNNMTLCAHSGFDIYEEDRYKGTFFPKTNVKEGFCDIVPLSGQMLEYTINFPLFDNVEELYIGLLESACVLAPSDYVNEGLPIVFYGSSITHGASASRPGNSYPAMVCRALNADYVNLGFSARARGETAMAEYIRDLPKSAFVMDFDHNAEGVKELKEKHLPFYKTVRGKDKNLPIIISSAPDIAYKPEFAARREVVLETYEWAKAQGDNVYFCDGAEFFKNAPYDCTVDNLHPNDLGFYNMARQFIKIFKENNILG